MSEQVMPFVGGQSDFLSLVNAEVEKVEPDIKASITSPEEQPPFLVLPESLPIPSGKPKGEQHLKASNFTSRFFLLIGYRNLCKTISELLQNRTDAHRTLSLPSV